MPEYKLVKYRGKYAVQWTQDGQRKRRSLGTDRLEEAKVKLAEIERIRSFNSRAEAKTVGDLWQPYIEDKAGLARFEVMIHQWKSLEPAFAHLAVDGIEPHHSAQYTEKRTSQGRKPGTIRGELLLIRQVLNWGVKKRLINHPSHIDVEPPPPPKDLYLSKSQARKFIEACGTPHIKLFVLLALATGGRKEAILELTWDRVDFERRQINLQKDTGRRRKGRALVPMNNELRAALQESKKGSLSDYVIEWAGGPVQNIKKGLKTAGERCGLPWVSAHVFRHSTGVWLAESGASMSEIAQFLGHKNSRTTEHVYARYSPDYLRGISENLTLNEPSVVHLHQRELR